MNQITGTIQNIFSDRPLQEDEYRNESDNLIHCAKCKTPRQHHVVVLGKEMVVPIRCRCQQEVQDKEEAERKQLQTLLRKKLRGLCAFLIVISSRILTIHMDMLSGMQ